MRSDRGPTDPALPAPPAGLSPTLLVSTPFGGSIRNPKDWLAIAVVSVGFTWIAMGTPFSWLLVWSVIVLTAWTALWDAVTFWSGVDWMAKSSYAGTDVVLLCRVVKVRGWSSGRHLRLHLYDDDGGRLSVRLDHLTPGMQRQVIEAVADAYARGVPLPRWLKRLVGLDEVDR
jgi:hypothetical protein